MPKLSTINAKKLIKLLQKKDFFIDRQSGSHVILIHKILGGRVVVPLHNGDLPRGTVLSILKMAGLEKKDLA